MNDITLYEKIPAAEKNFPIRFNPTQNCYVLHPHWHEHIELLFFTKGKTKVMCGSKMYSVKENDLIFVNSNNLHAFSGNTPVSYYCLLINPSFFADVNFENILIEPHIENDAAIHRMFTEIFEEYFSQSSGWDMAVKGKMYELMTYFLRNHKLAELPESSYNARIAKLNRMNTVLQFISEHYNEKISTSTLAQKCFLSEAYFCRFFKNEVGLPVSDYVNKMRIDKATVLLRNTTLSITELATNVGFDDINYFSRIFKKYKKMSPTEYRTHHEKAY